MSTGELSLACDEWVWLLTPPPVFLRGRAAVDTLLPWWPMTSLTSASGTQPVPEVVVVFVVVVAAVVLTDDDVRDDVRV